MLAILITLILIILGFFYKKSRYLFFFQALLVWVIIGFNQGGLDYDNYEALYRIFGYSLPEFQSNYLYTLSAYFGNQLGLSFFQFNLILSTFGCVILIRFIYKYSENPCFVMSLFYIAPLSEFVFQKKNFIAFIFMILAIQAIINKDKNYKMKFGICAILSTGFHSYMIVYSILLFWNKLNIKKVWRYSLLGLCIMFIILRFIPELAMNFFDSSKVNVYLDFGNTSLFVSICFILLQFIYTFFTIAFINRKGELTETDKFIKYMNSYLLILTPLYLFDSTFYRIYRNCILIDYIEISNSQRNGMLRNKITFTYTCFFILFIISYFIVMTFFVGQFGFMETYMPIFNENYILRIFVV